MKNLKYVIPFISFLASLLFISCSEEPVKPPGEEFDPPRFNWRSVEITGEGFVGIWALDTNDIYLLNHDNKTLHHINKGNASIYSVGNYGLNEIEGISNNEIYLFGTTPFPDNNLTIIKWNGVSFEYYPTGINASSDFTIRGFSANSNEIWICSQNGLSKFDGVNIINYAYEDSLLEPLDLFLSIDNKIQYISGRWVDTAHIQQCLFEFRDTGFVRIYDYTGSPYPTWSYTFLQEVAGNKIGLKISQNPNTICIDHFTGSSFTSYFCLNEKIESPVTSPSNNPVGVNPENFIFVVRSSDRIFEPSSKVGIVHWNGSKLSKEIGLAPSSFPYHSIAPIVFCISSNNYLVFEPHSFNNDIPTLHIGTKK